MILIADGGSTKTSWCLIDNNDRTITFETEGYHPFFITEEYMAKSLSDKLPKEVEEFSSQVKEICIYSAGGGYSKEADNILVRGVGRLFPNAVTTIETDLLASARALLGKEKGVAAILGTGSNSCLYDGENIIANIESLGFLLGDEGSGAYMGKRLIGDFIRGHMPTVVRDAFREQYKLSSQELIDKVYNDPTPNRYCASFTRFLTGDQAGHEYVDMVIGDCFNDFFKNIIVYYPNYSDRLFNCVGSIGWIFKDKLTEVAAEYGMSTGKIIRSPMEDLIEFHKALNRD